MYAKRWNVVLLFLIGIMPGLHTLRRVWDLAKYGSRDDPAGASLMDGFDPREVGRILSDNCFRAYISLIMVAHNVPKHMLSWMEACSCHDLGPMSSKDSSKLLEGELGKKKRAR